MQDVGSSSSALLVSQIMFVTSDTAAGPIGTWGPFSVGRVLFVGVRCCARPLPSLLNYRYEDAGLDVVGPRRRLRWSSQPMKSLLSLNNPLPPPLPQSLLPFHLLIRRL
jgi:hypothetical protein